MHPLHADETADILLFGESLYHVSLHRFLHMNRRFTVTHAPPGELIKARVQRVEFRPLHGIDGHFHAEIIQRRKRISNAVLPV